MYNVALQIGAPIGIAIANIIANGKNGDLATGAELLPGYRAAFYTYAIMGGVGLIVTIIFATNSDPTKMNETTTEGAAGTGDEEMGHESIDQITTEMKGSGIVSAGTTTTGSSTSLATTGNAVPGEKEELKM